MALDTHTSLLTPIAPNLPQVEAVFSPRFQEQFSNVLRLYFRHIDATFRALLGPDGGKYLHTPNGLAFSTITQSAAAANVGYPVMFENVYLTDSISVVAGSRVTVVAGGIYTFAFSGQATSTNASSKVVYIWLRRAGVDIGYSTRAYNISGSGTNMDLNWNFQIDVQPGSYMEIIWATTDTTVALTAAAATTPHPGIPSAVISVDYAAPLPIQLPTPP
jgi:hypothetical protein